MTEVIEGEPVARTRQRLDLGSIGPRRAVDAMAMYAFVALGLPDGMIGTAWPALRHSFGVSLDGLGIVLLLGTAGATCSSSVAGVVLARLGLRPTLIMAGTIAAVGALLAGLSPHFWTFLVAATAIGVTAGLLDGSLNTAVALAGRNRLLNALHGCYGVGTTIGPLVVTAAILVASWRPAYAVLLLAELALVGGWWAVGRRRAEPASQGPAGTGPASTGSASPNCASGMSASPGGAPAQPMAAGRPSVDETTRVLVNRATKRDSHRRHLVVKVSLGLVVFMTYTGFEVSAGQWGPSFERGPLGLGAAATGLATFGYWGSITVVRFALAAPRRPLSQRLIVNLGCAVAVLGAALVWWRPTEIVAIAGLVVIGGALAGVFPALVALTPGRVGEEMAHHVIGWQIGAASVGGAAISAAFGAVFQNYGLGYFGPALVIMAVLTMAGVLALERAAPILR
jgi:fucose permease